MDLIYIKKHTPLEGDGEATFVVPAVGIRTGNSVRLIPHPYGTETAVYETLEKAIQVAHRAGYSAEFEGQQYLAPITPDARLAKPTRVLSQQTPMMRLIEQAIPDLHQQLRDNVPSVVASAAFALGEIKDESALPGLMHSLSHEDVAVRKNVTEALAKIGKPALNAIRQSLQDKHWLVRHSGLSAVLELTRVATHLLPDILPETLPLLKDENWLVRSQAAMVYGEAAKAFQSQQE